MLHKWYPDKFYSYLLFYNLHLLVHSYIAVSKAKFAENVHIVCLVLIKL